MDCFKKSLNTTPSKVIIDNCPFLRQLTQCQSVAWQSDCSISLHLRESDSLYSQSRRTSQKHEVRHTLARLYLTSQPSHCTYRIFCRAVGSHLSYTRSGPSIHQIPILQQRLKGPSWKQSGINHKCEAYNPVSTLSSPTPYQHKPQTP